MPSGKIVVVFHSDECHYCHEYLPRFRRVAVRYRPFVAIKSVKVVAKNAGLLERYKIEGLPSTCILAADESLIKKVEGAIDEKAIERLFEKACG